MVSPSLTVGVGPDFAKFIPQVVTTAPPYAGAFGIIAPAPFGWYALRIGVSYVKADSLVPTALLTVNKSGTSAPKSL
jgi:hypothetical protein